MNDPGPGSFGPPQPQGPAGLTGALLTLIQLVRATYAVQQTIATGQGNIVTQLTDIVTAINATSTAQILSGTYTPSLTNTTNIAASTSYVAQYLKVGSVVTVSGKVDVDPTAAAATVLGISLPIASNLASAQQCAGTAAAPGIAGQCAAILGDSTADTATMQWVAVDVTNKSWYYTFTYQVI